MRVTDDMLRAAAPEPRYVLERRVQKRALHLTWTAWRHRHRGHLFPVADMDLSTEAAQRWADDTYGGLAVGIVPPEALMLGEEFVTHQFARVGIWHGFGWFLGMHDLVLADLLLAGSSLHRSHHLIGFVHVLPDEFQAIATAEWPDEDYL